MSKVSILVNCYNSEKYLKETLDSIFAQTHADFEVIFWDNCSTDNSPQIAKTYDSRLRYFRGVTTVPLYHARKLALEKVTGEFVTFLDCDDTWIPSNLSEKIPLFEDAQVGLVFSDVTYFNDTENLMQLYKTRSHYTGSCFSSLLSDYFLCLPSVIIRTNVLTGLKYTFDIRFDMIGDADLFRRIAMKWQFAYIDKPLANYRVHADALTQKSSEKFMEETYLMLETYEKEFPEIMSKNRSQVKILTQKFIFLKFWALWQKGSTEEALKVLKEVRPFYKRYLLTVFFFVFPYKHMNLVLISRRKLKKFLK